MMSSTSVKETTMKRTNIYLDEDLDRLLRYLALEQGRSFTDLVREVLLDYVKREGFPNPSRVRPPLRSMKDPEWRASFLEAVERIRAGVPKDMTVEEIEALITEASEEVRQELWGQRQALTTHD
jgi:hypothetical protein